MYFGQPKRTKMQLVRLEPLTPTAPLKFLYIPKMIDRLSHLNTSSLSFMQPMERYGATKGGCMQ